MQEIVQFLNRFGPLTGKELLQKCGCDNFMLWKTCKKSADIITRSVATMYLRLDKRVDGYARLSPSILREFLTYTIVGSKSHKKQLQSKADSLLYEIEKISRNKLELSREVISGLIKSQENSREIKEKAAFIIAGDIVYDMAHKELRPESSTSEMVKGSDLDIIIITANLPQEIIYELDKSIYKHKYYLLKMPAYREEIDYIIKDIDKVNKQVKFDDFESMVACKILSEGKFLCGSTEIFEEVHRILDRAGIGSKIKALEKKAALERKKAEACLLNHTGELLEDEPRNLFYTTEEKEEIF